MSEAFGSPIVGGDGMVYVPVPTRLYPGVINFLDVALRAEGNSPGVPAQEAAQAGVSGFPQVREWTRDDVRALNQWVRNPTTRAIFDLAKDKGGKSVHIRELEKFTGRTYEQVRGDLAGFSRSFRSKNWLDQNPWPYLYETASDGAASYRVRDDVLHWWREA